MTDLTVSKTILAQLGGSRFTLMTGSKNFVGSADALSFKVGRNANKVSHVRVTLTDRDDYTVEFLNIRGMVWVTRAKVEGVYCDNLQDVFTAHTGLYTRL